MPLNNTLPPNLYDTPVAALPCAAGVSPKVNIWQTDGLVEFVIEGFKSGHSNAFISRDIYRHFGINVSRNAVIGKLSRMGFKRELPFNPMEKAPRKAKSTASQKPIIIVKPIEFIEPETDDIATVFDILDLAQGQCKFPIGDPKVQGFGFCGHDTQGHKNYCPKHQKICRGAA